MLRTCACVAALALPLGRTLAGLGEWQGIVTTQDGDEVLEPGETASVAFFVEMSPSVGEVDESTGLKVQGFALSWSDFLATGSWSSGEVTWHINTRLIPLETPEIDPFTQSVIGVVLYQPDTVILTREDPVWIATLDWDPLGDYTPRWAGVRAEAQPLDSWGGADQQFGVWEGHDSSYGFEFFPWDLADAEFSFQIVPSPGLFGMLPMALFGCRRSRRAKSVQRST